MSRLVVRLALPALVSFTLLAGAAGQEAQLVEFPDPAKLFQNSSFTIEGSVAFVPTFDNDTLWSFSLLTGGLLDPDGLALPSPGNASNGYMFSGQRLAIPGWYPAQGVFVADVSDPSNLTPLGVIPFPTTTNIQGQQIAVDDNGYVGYVAGFPDDTLYSINIDTLQLEDPDGLVLPGNPDRIALAGQRLAIVDTTNKRILVVDVTDPANLALAGIISLPGTHSFGSNDTIAFADDGRAGFLASDSRVLFSFDVQTMTLLDPDGISFGTQGGCYGVVVHGNRAACPWDRGLTFFDISDPTDLRVIANANFGGTVAPQGDATVAFNHDGTLAAMPVVYPGNYIYTFDVATGSQFAPRYTVSAQPNYLTIFGADDRIGVACSNGDNSKIWLIEGLLGLWLGDLNCDGTMNNFDITPFVLALTATPPDYPEYYAVYPDCQRELGDINGDGHVDNFDITPFVAVLAG
jgi:hypothetical protein